MKRVNADVDADADVKVGRRMQGNGGRGKRGRRERRKGDPRLVQDGECVHLHHLHCHHHHHHHNLVVIAVVVIAVVIIVIVITAVPLSPLHNTTLLPINLPILIHARHNLIIPLLLPDLLGEPPLQKRRQLLIQIIAIRAHDRALPAQRTPILLVVLHHDEAPDAERVVAG